MQFNDSMPQNRYNFPERSKVSTFSSSCCTNFQCVSKRKQQKCISLGQRTQQVVHVADAFIQSSLQYTCYRNNPFRISLGLGVQIEGEKEQLQPLRHITPTARQSPTEIHLCLLNEERKSCLEEKSKVFKSKTTCYQVLACQPGAWLDERAAMFPRLQRSANEPLL